MNIHLWQIFNVGFESLSHGALGMEATSFCAPGKRYSGQPGQRQRQKKRTLSHVLLHYKILLKACLEVFAVHTGNIFE